MLPAHDGCEINFVLLTGNEGGKMMCLGELFNVPTATTAFTGMVNIWGQKQHQVMLLCWRNYLKTTHQPAYLIICGEVYSPVVRALQSFGH